MFLAPEDLSRFFSMLDERARKSEQVLNAADAKIGDGDTGSMLCRVLSAIASAQLAQAEQLSGAAILAAQAAMKETGSSLGTLVATGAMAFAKEAKKRGDKVKPDDLASVIASIRDAVSERGKAAPGDKTIVDSLDAIATALADGPTDLETAKQDVLYAKAETQNVRRRLEKDVQDARNYAATSFARDILSVADNLARALEQIAEAGYWRIGLTGAADATLSEALAAGPIALVLGAEGEGMRHNIETHCDALARLPIGDTIESLNVSNAGAIALYAVATR